MPGLATEVVAGNTLTLTYDEALDEDSTPAASAFTVTSDTNPAVTVTGVSVSGTMVVLTLSRVVAASETVTVSYTVPAGQADAKLQDTQGNPAGDLSAKDVTNDTAAPEVVSARVSGMTLTLTYDEALDEDSTPAASAFTVTSDTNPAVTVTGVSVSGTMVVLTLSRVVAASETVTVSYTVPGTGSKLQDALGNPAANLSDRAVTNEVEVEPPASEVIAPTAIAQTAGVRAETGYAASHLIDGSGLSESPTVDNLSSVTHADPTAGANPNTGWRTAADGLIPNVLVTPVSIMQTQGDPHPSYAPGKLIDGSGLSSTPTAENWESVAHPWEGLRERLVHKRYGQSALFQQHKQSAAAARVGPRGQPQLDGVGGVGCQSQRGGALRCAVLGGRGHDLRQSGNGDHGSFCGSGEPAHGLSRWAARSGPRSAHDHGQCVESGVPQPCGRRRPSLVDGTTFHRGFECRSANAVRAGPGSECAADAGHHHPDPG